MNQKVYKLLGPKNLIIETDLNFDFELSQNEYLVETLYSAISPGTETAAFSGMEPLKPGTIYPRVVGYCNVGRVIRIGASVSKLKEGDYILTFQSHRNLFKQNIDEFAIKLPATADYKKLVVTYLFHLGLHALQTAEVKAGNHVGIIGAGTLGLTTAMMSALSNANTIVFSNQRLKETFNKLQIKQFSKNNWSDEELAILTNNIGFDVIINTSNKWEDWELALRLVRKGGLIVNIGFPGRGEPLPKFNPLDPKYIYFKNIQIKPLQYINESDCSPDEFRFNMHRNVNYIIENIVKNKLDASIIISEEIHYLNLGRQYEKYLERNNSLFSTLINWKDENI